MIYTLSHAATAAAPFRLGMVSGLAPESMPARVSRVRTTDGGVVLLDRGATRGDVSFRFQASMSLGELSRLDALRRISNHFWVGTTHGAFRGAITDITGSGPVVSISFSPTDDADEWPVPIAGAPLVETGIPVSIDADDGVWVSGAGLNSVHSLDMLCVGNSYGSDYRTFIRFTATSEMPAAPSSLRLRLTRNTLAGLTPPPITTPLTFAVGLAGEANPAAPTTWLQADNYLMGRADSVASACVFPDNTFETWTSPSLLGVLDAVKALGWVPGNALLFLLWADTALPTGQYRYLFDQSQAGAGPVLLWA